MTIFGVDLSSWKPVSDIQAVKDAGNEFLITKCTGGLTYKNPLYAEQIAQARSVGLLVGHYHFLHESSVDPTSQPDYRSVGRMQAEADWFLANVDLRPGEIVCLDVEDAQVNGNLTPCVAMWCGYVSAKLGFLPLIYTYPSYITERSLSPVLTRYPLWYASYPETPQPGPWPAAPSPWDKVTLWQWTASQSVPGIGDDVDANIFDGTPDDFRALGMPDQNRVVPQAHPEGEATKAQRIRAYINDQGEACLSVNFGGNCTEILGVNIVDLGISVKGVPDGTYDISVQGNVFTPWHRRDG